MFCYGIEQEGKIMDQLSTGRFLAQKLMDGEEAGEQSIRAYDDGQVLVGVYVVGRGVAGR